MFLLFRRPEKIIKTIVCVLIVFLLGVNVSFAEAEGSVNKRERLIRKLRTIHIPVIEFEDAEIFSVIRFLSRLSRRYDSNKTGVTIVAGFDRKQVRNLPGVTLSLSGRSLTLMNVIELLCESTDYNYYIQENAVIISLSPPPKRIESKDTSLQKVLDIAATEKKLKETVIENVDFDNLTVEAAVKRFQKLANKHDMNIILSHTVNKDARKRVVNMILPKRTFYQALYFFCRAVNLDFRIANNAVIISSPPPAAPKKQNANTDLRPQG